MRRSKPLICFFDSGIGGLNILAAFARRAPFADLTYFADNYNVPYGNLPLERLLSLTDAIFDKIAALDPDVAVVACNTVTSRCIDRLRARYKFPIVGIQPAVKPAAEHCKNCIVLSTPTTAASPAVKELVTRYGNGATTVFPCPQLAAYIEENIFSPDPEKIESYLPKTPADGVVLGCTHYIFVKDIIERFYGCKAYDGVEGTVNRIMDLLAENRRIPGGSPNYIGNYRGEIAFVGGDIAKNAKICKRMFCGEIFPKKSTEIPQKVLTRKKCNGIIYLQTREREYFMVYLTGEYEHQMDTKNRIRFPSKLKGEEPGFYFSKGVNHCIAVYTQQGFERLNEKLNETLDEGDPEQMLASRIFAKSFVWVEGDAQGRMILPPKLKEFAKIDKEVMICGAIDHIEIWSKPHYEEYYKNEDEKFDNLYYALRKKK